MAKPITDRQRYLLEDVAHMSYIQNMSQQDIADKLFISRSQISRMLQEAREQGIVDIRIRYTAKRDYAMEDRLKERFGLTDARVMSSHDVPDADERFAQMGARLFSDLIRPNMIIGLTWGSSVRSVLREVQPNQPAPIQVVQVMGSSMLDSRIHDAQDLVRSLAQKYHGTPHYIPAPLVVLSDAAYAALSGDAQVARTLELASFSDLLLTGVGTLMDVMISKHPWLGYMTPDMLAELKQKKAVGSICARFFDAEGRIIDCHWNAHCVGITLESIRRMENIVAVARGESKAEAILGALRGGFINTLITDGTTSRKLLELA